MKKQSDKKLAEELAVRLDAGRLEPTDADSAEMRDLMALYARLDDAVEGPSPKLQGWVRRSFRERGVKARVSAWMERVRGRWLAWLPRRYHPALAVAAAMVVLLVALPAFLGSSHRFYTAVGNEQVSSGIVADDAGNVRGGRTDAPALLYSAVQDRERYYDGTVSGALDGADARGSDSSFYEAGSVSDAVDEQAGYRDPADVESGDGHSDDGRMVVRRAALTFVVQDAEASFARVQEIAAENGGGIYSLESGKTARGSLQTFVSIQVPVAACDQVLAQLRGMEAELLSEQVTSQDVTASYVDLDARVRNLELAEQELQELLEAARERGEKAQGILSIYDELIDIRQQIEQLKGQMTLLEHSAALARIDVALIPEEIAPEPAGFDAGRVLREAWEEVVRIFEDIAAFFIRAFAYAPLILPPLLVVALVAWMIVRGVRRRSLTVAGEEDVRDE
ncbi:MAG: DUF4349 domain-containing protein [Anaerolineae bacterium]|nr:DUF4349 domain-containing protein [Anaerolineae bacterium]